MTTSVAVAIISALAVAAVPAISYYLTKWEEREADLRKHKFEHYRELLDSLSSIVGSDATPEGHRRFARSCNTLYLVASAHVVNALQQFRDEIAVSNPNHSTERHDALLTKLLEEIRVDLRIPHRPDQPLFQARLWCSGTNETDKPSHSLARFLENAPDNPPEPWDRI